MVKAMHEAGIEVILDVVYNHTAEGNHLGPMLSFKGIDNEAYYRLVPDDPRFYMDYTGTGNTLNVRHPHVLQLIMDSLRYWILEMHVDGFRFDLAATLARKLHDVDRLSAFFDIIQQDPVISQVKLIAEPWDVGEGGYQVGQLPAAVVRVERPLPRHRARLLAGRGRDARRVRVPLHRLERPVRGHRAPAVRVDQLRHRARRLHACATSSPTTTSTTRRTARTTTTARATTGRGTAASRVRPTIPRSTRCGPGSSATSSPRSSSPRACRCCSAATRSGAPRAATTTRTARTTRSAGSTGTSVDESLLAVHAASSRGCGPSTRCSGAGVGSSAGRSTARTSATSSGSCPTARAMSEDDWQATFAKSLARLPQRRRDPGARPAARPCATTASTCCSTRTTSR